MEFFSRTKTSGAAATSFLKGAKRLKKQKNVFDTLPQDSRTLLKTPRTVVVEGMANGNYYHFGLEKGILNLLKTSKLRRTSLKVLVNVDGLPLFKSSTTSFWPILGKVRGQHSPFPIGVWCDPSKLKWANERPFVDEAKKLEEDGVIYCEQHYTVKIWGFR